MLKKNKGLKILATVAVVFAAVFGAAAPAFAVTNQSTGSIYSTDGGNRTGGVITWNSSSSLYAQWTINDVQADGKAARLWVQTYARNAGVVDTDFFPCMSGNGTSCSVTSTASHASIYAIDVWVCNGGSSTSRINCTVRVFDNPLEG